MSSRPVSYRLAPPAAAAGPVPVLAADQQAVVDHAGGPLLVLAGPGTGKTTTLVEAIAARIERDGVAPDSILALTFSRKAAEQLRDRVTARIGRTTAASMSSTFHSFAYRLIRAYAPADLYDAPLRLLSAPEQDVVLRELLTDHPESVQWPPSLRAALGTRGFAREVTMVLGRAREKGLSPEDLTALGQASELPEFIAAGAFLDQYLTVLDSKGATDYADLIRRATFEAELHREQLRARFSHVFVDEYQDTDPGQVALLRAVAGDGRNLTVVGDPHQSIYGFRGAEVRGILEFPTVFPQAGGAPAPVIALRTTRRFGPRLLRASQQVAGRLSLQGTIPEAAREAFLAPVAASGPHGPGKVEVVTFDTERAEAEHLADLLRRAHLEDGVGWDEMAVLVRSGRASIPALRRSLGAAGVPVEVGSDDIPLVQDPAVLPLLDVLRAVVHLEETDPEAAAYVDPLRAEAMLTGPLGGLDAGDVRRLARALRTREKERAAASGTSARPSRDLLRLAVVEGGFLDGLAGPEATRARALSELLVRAREQMLAGATAEEVLWTLWSGTGWPQRLRRGVESGGGAARRAHRDLDAICALFEAAARAEEQRDHVGVVNFLATLVAQQIPGDTLADRGVRGASVRLLTAHRSKGLEWRLVAVAHVQEGGWPDLRRRSSLLRADLIGADAVTGAPLLQPALTTRELLMEERRLFYVACTRARERLVVTAVRSSDDEGEQPSRFLADLFPSEAFTPDRSPIAHRVGRPPRPLSLGGLVAELRRTVTDPEAPEPLREAAARRLARLATESLGERALVPAADPSNWWGTRAASRSVQPVRDPEKPVPISASMLDGVLTCPTQWFLEREAGGAGVAHQSANLGQLVHAVAERVATGELTPQLDALMAHVDSVWDRLAFRTPWSRAREHERVRGALAKFLAWHQANPRKVLEVEGSFAAEVELDGGEQVTLRGYADRLELDAEGRIVVVDLKTGRGKPTGPAVARHTQLALYQYAVDAGAVPDVAAGSGGAELVQLGLEDGLPDATVQRQDRHAADGPERALIREQLALAAGLVRAETFPAVAGQHCDRCAFTAVCPAKSAGSVVTQ